MSQLPNAGDLAVVLRGCGCPNCDDYIGLHVTVDAVVSGVGLLARCTHCGRSFGQVDCVTANTPEGELGFVRSWLRRVPPLAELESIDIVDEIESERPRVREAA